MDRPIHDITPNDVEREIRGGFRRLRFDVRMERQFEADEGDHRCRYMIRQNYIGLFIYHCFLFSDFRSIGDVFQLDLFVHFGIMTPLMILTNYIISHRPPVWLREGLQMLSLILLTSTIVVVVSASQSPDRDIVHFSAALVVSFATIMQRIRFWYVAAGCVAIQALYGVGLTTMTPFSMDRTIMSNSVFLGVVIFSLVGSYNLEHEQRRGYLLALRDRFRNRDLKIASLRDALTGVGNRRALELALNRPEGDPPRSAAILLLDIDHFKLFNDTHGHQEGDACLRRVAGLVEGTIRQGEGTVYRFGGEEFLVLLDDVSLDDALLVAERVRSSVASARIPLHPTPASFVTVSVGAAAGSAKGDATFESLIAAADRALYEAKNGGRNQVWPRGDRSFPGFDASKPRMAS